MNTLRLSNRSWSNIRAQLHLEYPRSVLALSWKTKQVLGFTVRNHYHSEIHLDFYNEHKRTLFLLKFSDCIEHPTRNKLEVS